MSEQRSVTLLGVVKLANTGILLWETVGPMVQAALANREDITLDDVEVAAITAGVSLATLAEAIDRAKAEGR